MKATLKSKNGRLNLLTASRQISGVHRLPVSMVSGNGAGSDAQLRTLKQKLIKQGVKYCVGAYVDIHGVPKGKFVPIEHFEHFARGSELYTGYALDGLGQEPNDDEIASVPDLGHIIQLPWRKEVAVDPGGQRISRPTLSAQLARRY